MKKYQSPTKNGGTTIILDCIEEAIEHGRAYLTDALTELRDEPAYSKLRSATSIRDKPHESLETTVGQYRERLVKRSNDFEQCVAAITVGDRSRNHEILHTSEALLDVVTEIEPSLAAGYAGFARSEDGIDADVSLLASGDAQPFLRRQNSGPATKQGRGGSAYRILLNTDVGWFGRPEDNAAVVGALVVCLQRFGPVEVWVQQGWLGQKSGDGVTLFKLDFSGGFEPTHLAFWCGHPLRDACFSFEVNLGLGRDSSGTSKYGEIPADLFLRGDWMKMYGISEDFPTRLHLQKVDLLTAWIAQTAMQIVSSGPKGDDGLLV